MNISYTIRGAAELDAKLTSAPQGSEQVIAQADAAAAPIVAAGVARETPVRTGALVRSEDVFVRDKSLEFQATVFYADFVARGTSRQAANPFDVRGAAAAETAVVQEFEREAELFAREFDQ